MGFNCFFGELLSSLNNNDNNVMGIGLLPICISMDVYLDSKLKADDNMVSY